MEGGVEKLRLTLRAVFPWIKTAAPVAAAGRGGRSLAVLALGWKINNLQYACQQTVYRNYKLQLRTIYKYKTLKALFFKSKF
jgi:hypothetical protein